MWQLFLEQLMRDLQRQTLRQGVKGAGLAFIGGLNKPEAYADRINREFNLRNYAKAWDIYDSNRAYWEKLYGHDPVTSPHHPASPPKSLLPRQPDASDHGDNFLDPATTSAEVFGPFSTGRQFAPGSATSSWPLYDTQPFVPPIGSTPRGTTEGNFAQTARRCRYRREAGLDCV